MRSVLVILALLVGCNAFSFGGMRRRMTGTRKPHIGGRGFHSGFNGNFNGGGGRIGASSVGDDSAEPPKEPESDENSGFGAIWEGYNKVLEEKPLATKAMTSLVGFLIGDVLAQLFIDKSDSFDFYRTFRLASFGAVIHGPTGHWFYGMLDGKIPGTGALAVASKVGIDQVLWNPIFGIMFFSYMGALEGKGLTETIAKVKNDLLTQVTGSWKVWPIAHAINFKFIPTSQRLLYINSIQIFYNMFLSVIGNRS